ncbi:integration host factor subunit beta [Desulfurispirillum indicum]|uniref:Histone family protein DNA-binding protein n=1 Tax=Desulfurispirillum indicum (strain ATCC BAA-1389 / DSM 22839 / S5) TaxID=653733 RepID=E6W176_DESIS|nr:integration host factor subunit beta [Desulfurispirillum indicum]ADU66496.1 histone family protein DNA-binding protein [Desulfurispirillum indicum S5]UCZ55830.1 integration host factor subunit beta [Desulfurispirillum indicum]
MTKADLVERICEKTDSVNKKQAEAVVNGLFECIIDALEEGDKVELRGFGSFKTRERGPREGRNPKTGDKVSVPSKRVPYFKPGKELRERVDNA